MDDLTLVGAAVLVAWYVSILYRYGIIPRRVRR